MKWLGMLVVCTLLGSLGFGAFLYRKHKEHESLLRNSSYMETKVHVSRDVLSEYQADVAAMQEDVELIQKQMNDLSAAVEKEQAEYNGRKGEMDACQGDKKESNDETAALEGENKRLQEWFNGEKGKWAKEIENLKKQLEGHSNMCNFVEKTSDDGMKMCGKTAEPAAKQETPKEAQQ